MFEAYSSKDLQHFLQMMNQCEAIGITDIRFVRQKIYNHLYKPQKVRPVKASRMNQFKQTLCPSCKSGMLIGSYNIDGLNIKRCSKKCGYSKVVA